jgi:hypothetical protein
MEIGLPYNTLELKPHETSSQSPIQRLQLCSQHSRDRCGHCLPSVRRQAPYNTSRAPFTPSTPGGNHDTYSVPKLREELPPLRHVRMYKERTRRRSRAACLLAAAGICGPWTGRADDLTDPLRHCHCVCSPRRRIVGPDGPGCARRPELD